MRCHWSHLNTEVINGVLCDKFEMMIVNFDDKLLTELGMLMKGSSSRVAEVVRGTCGDLNRQGTKVKILADMVLRGK